MEEYIEKQAALGAILGEPPEAHYPSWYAEKIKALSAADVAPVVHGQWDDSGRYTFLNGRTAVRCSECGCCLTKSEYRFSNWYYCPVCGARMDGGATHDNL